MQITSLRNIHCDFPVSKTATWPSKASSFSQYVETENVSIEQFSGNNGSIHFVGWRACCQKRRRRLLKLSNDSYRDESSINASLLKKKALKAYLKTKMIGKSSNRLEILLIN